MIQRPDPYTYETFKRHFQEKIDLVKRSQETIINYQVPEEMLVKYINLFNEKALETATDFSKLVPVFDIEIERKDLEQCHDKNFPSRNSEIHDKFIERCILSLVEKLREHFNQYEITNEKNKIKVCINSF